MSEPAVVEIPLNKIAVPNRGNVRTVAAGPESDTELETSIRTHGLLSSLVVIPGKGETEKYWVVAGSRRHRALKAVGPKDRPVPCRVLDLTASDLETWEASAAENLCRVPLHPFDQFGVFGRLRQEGSTAAEIAARFGMAESTVLRRLRENEVAPEVKEAYRQGRIGLDQLREFTVCSDHDRQREVLEKTVEDPRFYYDVKSMLMGSATRGDKPLAAVVGIEDYRAAGGVVSHDLFVERGDRPGGAESGEESERRGTFFEDTELLTTLAQEKLEARAEELRGEGWKWVEVCGVGYDNREYQWRKMKPSEGDEFGSKQKANGGCFVKPGYGGIEVVAGLVNPKDEKKAAAAEQEDADGYMDGGAARQEVLSEGFKQHMANERGRVIRKVLRERSTEAIDLLLFELVRKVFGSSDSWWPHALGISTNEAPGPDDRPDAISFLKDGDTFEDGQVDGEYRAWLQLDEQQRDEAAAAAISRIFLDRLASTGSRRDGTYIEAFIESLDIDWPALWRPTKDNYFSKLKRGQLNTLAFELFGAEEAEARFDGVTKRAMCEVLEKECGAGGPHAEWMPPGFVWVAVERPDPAAGGDDIGEAEELVDELDEEGSTE